MCLFPFLSGILFPMHESDSKISARYIYKKKKIRLFFSLEGHWKFEGKGLRSHSLLTTMHACAQMFPPKSFHSHHRFRTFYELLLHVHLAFLIDCCL